MLAVACWIGFGLLADRGRYAAAMEMENGHLNHQWITLQAHQLFRHQFGPSELDAFIGAVQEYPSGSKSLVTEGAYDEDLANAGANPFGQALTHPALRHFWDHRGDYARDFDDGLLGFDSAPNRGIKYFTGGYGLTGVLDTNWGDGQGAQVGQGIQARYAAGGPGTAYYWLGHAVHLLEDLALPAHALANEHLQGFGYFDNPDPVHDWVDGVEFSVAGTGADGRTAAAFDDVATERYRRWTFNATLGGVGRTDNPASFRAGPLRSPGQLRAAHAAGQLSPLTNASVPDGVNDAMLPVYLLYSETSQVAADFDSRDKNGRIDQGGRRGDGSYAGWTRTELDQVADVAMPTAMVAAAEMFRFFYAQVDATAPTAELPGLSGDSAAPTPLLLAPGQSTRSISLTAIAADSVSGVDLDGFTYRYAPWSGSGWGPESVLVSGSTAEITGLGEGRYRIWFSVENGGGLSGQSAYAYVLVVPEPTSMLASGITILLIGSLRRRRGGRTNPRPAGRAVPPA